MESYIVNNLTSDARLDVYMQEKVLTDLTRSAIKNLIKGGNVLVNGKTVKAGFIVKTNDVIEYEQQKKQPQNVEAENIKIRCYL